MPETALVIMQYVAAVGGFMLVPTGFAAIFMRPVKGDK